jgi:serine/threonine-protein kinase PknK
MQAGLLRVLQEQKVRPVGGTTEEHVDVRLVFATHRDLAKLVEEGAFREDLYYRIRVVDLAIPPLRERREDIPQLVDHFLGIFAARYRRDKKTVSREALRLLMAQPWRGNVRELEHMLLNAWVLTDEDELDVEDFDLGSTARPNPRPSESLSLSSLGATGQARAPNGVARRTSSGEEERQRIMDALSACGQNRVRAAQLLGMPRRTFYRRLKEFAID